MIIKYPATLIFAFAVTVAMAITTTATRAAGPELTTSTSTNTVRVAEPFTLTIIVRADKGTKVTFPEGQTRLGSFDVRDTQDRFDIPTDTDSNSRTWTRTLTLDTIETGDLQIPPINVQVQPPPGDGRLAFPSDVQQFATGSILIRVASVLEDRADPTKFRDIESVLDVSVPKASTSTLAWATGSAGLTAIALLFGVAVHRRRRWTTPVKWAITQLDSLDPDTQEATPQLSSIMRDFLLMQFEISHPGGTPHEIVNQLQANKKLAAMTGERLKCLFEIADKSKFAGLCLSPEGSASAVKDSRSLVMQIADTH